MLNNIQKVLILRSRTIKEAMKQLDESSEKVLYAIDEKHKLIGALSDGDVRRAILKGINLDNEIDLIINKNPKFIYEDDKDKNKKIKKTMIQFKIESLPVVNDKKIIIDIVFWTNIFDEVVDESYQKKENYVFVLAGGIGSRLEPFTKVLPKPLVPLGEEPILEKIMDKFNYYGFEKFILSVNYKADMIKMYFSDPEVNKKYTEISYIKESIPLGTIGSLYLAKDIVKDTFFITNADILVLEDMEKIFEFHKSKKAILTLVGCVKNSVIPYGVLNIDENGLLINIDEKPEYRHIINTGVYVAEPEIINYIEENVKKDITEIISDLKNDGQRISVYPIFEDQWFDIGQWAEFERTRKYFEK